MHLTHTVNYLLIKILTNSCNKEKMVFFELVFPNLTCVFKPQLCYSTKSYRFYKYRIVQINHKLTLTQHLAVSKICTMWSIYHEVQGNSK